MDPHFQMQRISLPPPLSLSFLLQNSLPYKIIKNNGLQFILQRFSYTNFCSREIVYVMHHWQSHIQTADKYKINPCWSAVWWMSPSLIFLSNLLLRCGDAFFGTHSEKNCEPFLILTNDRSLARSLIVALVLDCLLFCRPTWWWLDCNRNTTISQASKTIPFGGTQPKLYYWRELINI